MRRFVCAGVGVLRGSPYLFAARSLASPHKAEGRSGERRWGQIGERARRRKFVPSLRWLLPPSVPPSVGLRGRSLAPRFPPPARTASERSSERRLVTPSLGFCRLGVAVARGGLPHTVWRTHEAAIEGSRRNTTHRGPVVPPTQAQSQSSVAGARSQDPWLHSGFHREEHFVSPLSPFAIERVAFWARGSPDCAGRSSLHS